MGTLLLIRQHQLFWKIGKQTKMVVREVKGLIDTLILTSKEFEIKNKVVGLKTKTIFNNDTGEVEAENSFLRTDNYTLDLNLNGARVVMNPSKIVNGHNFYPADHTVIKTACDLVSEDLQTRGLIIPFDEMRISRLDVVQNGFTKRNPREFNQLLEFMNAKRMEARKYPNGYLFGNKQRAVCFYDKLTELKDIHHFDTGALRLDNGVNVIRAELRFLKTNAVAKNTGFNRVSELYNADSIEHLKDCYKAVLKDTVFRDKNQHQQVQFNFEKEVELMAYIREKYKRNAIDKYLLCSGGLPQLIEKIGTIENLKYIMDKAGYERSHIYRITTELQDLLKLVASIDTKYTDKHTIAQLYEELYNMLVA